MVRRRLVLAHPCYGPLEPLIEKRLRVAVMEASKENEWVGDVSTIRRGWVDGRNASAKDAVEAGNVDYVVWIDDDVNIIYPDTIARMVRYNEDFVTGILFQKLEPFYPLISRWNEEKQGFSPFETWPENTFLPVDGCGFGVCVTSTKLLRKIQSLPSFEKDGWFNQIPGPRGVPYSEDFSFCLRAKEAGVQLYADTAILLEHQIGPEFASIRNHKAAEAARRNQDGKL